MKKEQLNNINIFSASGKTARRNYYVCDQGHYGSCTCSNCGTDITWKDDICPKCKSPLIGDNVDYNWGGSDFD